MRDMLQALRANPTAIAPEAVLKMFAYTLQNHRPQYTVVSALILLPCTSHRSLGHGSRVVGALLEAFLHNSDVRPGPELGSVEYTDHVVPVLLAIFGVLDGGYLCVPFDDFAEDCFEAVCDTIVSKIMLGFVVAELRLHCAACTTHRVRLAATLLDTYPCKVTAALPFAGPRHGVLLDFVGKEVDALKTLGPLEDDHDVAYSAVNYGVLSLGDLELPAMFVRTFRAALLSCHSKENRPHLKRLFHGGIVDGVRGIQAAFETFVEPWVLRGRSSSANLKIHWFYVGSLLAYVESWPNIPLFLGTALAQIVFKAVEHEVCLVVGDEKSDIMGHLQCGCERFKKELQYPLLARFMNAYVFV